MLAKKKTSPLGRPHAKALPQANEADLRVQEVCTAIGQFVEYWGFKALYGRVWALLAARAEPISQAQIAKTLGVSRASVSAAIAELSRYKLVRPVGPGRNAPYQAMMDVWPTITDVLRQREWMLLESARVALEATVEEVELGTRVGVESVYSGERLQVLLTMTELAQSLLKLLIALRAPRAITLSDLRLWGGRAAAFVHGVRRHAK